MADQTRYYPFLPKGSSGDSFKTVTNNSYASALPGDVATGIYPYTSSIDAKYISNSGIATERKYIYALTNTLERNKLYSPHYAYSSSLGNKSTQIIKLVSIPSIFYGSSIEKGSVELDFFISGTLVGKIQDTKLNGELIETTGSQTGSVAGVILYNEGFILLTGSWSLSSQTDTYHLSSSTIPTNPKWIYWGSGLNLTNNQTVSSSFDLKYNGVNYVPTITMFAHAEKGDLNHSNNPTYIKYGEASTYTVASGSTYYVEPSNLQIKNITKYAYENYTGSLEKQTYITKIGIYDEDKNLIAVAKVAKPVHKSENRDFTFKLKLDI